MTILLIVALVGAAVLLTESGAFASMNDQFDTAAPMESWGQLVTKSLPPADEHPDATSASPSGANGDDVWVTYYKQHGYHVPPEYPVSPADFGVGGDLNTLPPELRDRVTAALFMDEDPNSLLALSDDAALSGYPLAAQRLVKKAMRLIV